MKLSSPMRALATTTHAALIALMLWQALSSGAGLWLALPLLLPAWGIARGRSYTCAWASMLVLFYCAGYLSEGYARPQHRLWAFSLATIAAVEFASLVLYVRLAARERSAAARTAG